MYGGLQVALVIVAVLGVLTVPSQPSALAATVSLSLAPSEAGTATIQGAGDPAAALRISIDGSAVQTCAGSPCSHTWTEAPSTPPHTVAARTLDAKNWILGEATVRGPSRPRGRF